MLPTPFSLLTVRTPSATVHLAGDLSLAETHSSRFLPSNSTIASEGGAVLFTPGVTTLGTGSQTSVSSGFGFVPACAADACCPAPWGARGRAGAGVATAIRAVKATSVKNEMGITLHEHTPAHLPGTPAGRGQPPFVHPQLTSKTSKI